MEKKNVLQIRICLRANEIILEQKITKSWQKINDDSKIQGLENVKGFKRIKKNELDDEEIKNESNDEL